MRVIRYLNLDFYFHLWRERFRLRRWFWRCFFSGPRLGHDWRTELCAICGKRRPFNL